jgi:hypothetical protein
MHRAPAIRTIADESRNALRACEVNQGRNEGMIAVAMNRWRKTNHRDAHALGR